MAKLIPAVILLFCFSALLSSSHARSLLTSPEDESTDLKPLILLPTDKFLAADTVPSLVNVDEKISSEMKSFGHGEKPTNRRFERLRAFKCRHGHGGDQIRPGSIPFWKEGSDDEHHHHHHHGEVDPASVEGEGRLIGEFKEPHFFFGHHHHHYRHHHDGDEEHEEREHHHRHGRGHGFWKSVRKFLGRF